MRIVRKTARRVFKPAIAIPKNRPSKVKVRKIIPGSIALNNERKIAEAIAMRSNELRSSLSTLAQEHAEYLDRCNAEKHKAKAAADKETVRLASLKAALANIENKVYDDKRAWLESKKQADALRAELVKKIADAKAYAEDMRQRRDSVEKSEVQLKTAIRKVSEEVSAREADIRKREAVVVKTSAFNERENIRIQQALVTLSEREQDYAARVNALVVREIKATAVLAKEEIINTEERRIDLKAQQIQEDGKVLNVERANLARRKARLGRIRHLKQGAVK
jgi:hypothetical protein